MKVLSIVLKLRNNKMIFLVFLLILILLRINKLVIYLFNIWMICWVCEEWCLFVDFFEFVLFNVVWCKVMVIKMYKMIMVVMGIIKKRNVEIWNIIVILKIYFGGIVYMRELCSGFLVVGLCL